MSIVIPSILTASRADLVAKLGRLEGLVDTVQLDIVDGVFAYPATWPYAEGSEELAGLSNAEDGLQSYGSFRYEVDLMVKEPEAVIGSWISAGATRLIVHVESTQYLDTLLKDLADNYGHDKGFAPDLLSVGLAINMATDTAALEPYLDRIDYVQFMGIGKIGSQGQPFDQSVIEKIRLFKKAHPDMPVQIDGGVSLATAPELLTAGVDRFAVGSDLWKSQDISSYLKQFATLIERYGRYS